MAEQQFFFGVHGVIVKDGKILVLKRAPEMAYQPGSWDLPGGHLALNESIEECLRREVQEETGLQIEIQGMLGHNRAVPEPYIQALYLCRIDGDGHAVRLRAYEHVDFCWTELAQLAGMTPLIPYLGAIIRAGMLDFLEPR